MAQVNGATQPLVKSKSRRRVRSRRLEDGWLISDDDAPSNEIGLLYDSGTHREEICSHTEATETCYVALTPRVDPLSNPRERQWTIIATQTKAGEEERVKKQEPLIRLNSSSKILQAFQRSLYSLAGPGASIASRSRIPVHIASIQPLVLAHVVIEINVDALKNYNKIQQRFAGGFLDTQPNGYTHNRKGKAKLPARTQSPPDSTSHGGLGKDSRIAKAIKDALISYRLLRTGALITLPLPTHPITHAAFPPARVVSCHPVLQGVVCSRTSIVVQPSSSHVAMTVERNGVSPEVSDESSDNTISIEPPQLPYNPVLSPGGSATPRSLGSRFNAPGTPGSVLSAYTASTTGNGARMKAPVFSAKGLLGRVPEHLLNPTPSIDEDDEARVFVSMNALVKLRCFSGTWVSLQSASGAMKNQETSSAVESLMEDSQSNTIRRPVKVYGLTGLPLDRRALDHHKALDRATSGRSCQTLEAWMSPILLANLGNPDVVRICKIAGSFAISQNKVTTKVNEERPTMEPSDASEITLNRIATPLSSDKALQGALLARLKVYFERRRRLHKEGDLIALDVDLSVGRLMGSSGDDLDLPQDIVSGGAQRSDRLIQDYSTGVAWFRVSSLKIKGLPNGYDSDDNVDWLGAAYVEPTNTPIGVEQSRIPASSQNTWEFYFGSRLVPIPPSETIHSYAAFQESPTRAVLPSQARLKELIEASVSSHALHLGIDPTIVLLYSSQRNIGKSRLCVDAASALGLHVFTIDAYDLLAEGGSTEVDLTFQARVGKALSCGSAFTVLHIRHIEAFTSGRMVTVLRESFSTFRAVVCTTTDLNAIPETVRTSFTHEIEVHAPNESERKLLLRSIIAEKSVRIAPDVSISSLALKTAALVAGNLVDIVDRAVTARQNRLSTILHDSTLLASNISQLTMQDLLISAGPSMTDLTISDFNTAIDAARASFSDSIGAPKIPTVSWADVGGLASVKDAVLETIQLPLARPELFAKGMKKRSGILFYGPPGTGKTLLAKAIATEFSLNFFSVKGPELLNMYIGESEANVRRVFQRARDARPCVVFFDELDSVAPKRGNQGDSGGVMDRIVSQLLAELDGMSDSSSASEDGTPSNGGVFVIGATNRPDLLDQALLRPGRFDKLLYLGISDTHEKQETILKALTRKFQLHPACNLARVASQLPFTYTGADLYALCSDAMLKAVMRSASKIDAKAEQKSCSVAQFFDLHAMKADLEVLVEEEDFEKASRELVGSVSTKELEHYQRVRERFEHSDESFTVNGSFGKGQGKGTMNEVNGSLPPKPSFGNHTKPLLSKPTRKPKPIKRTDTAIMSSPAHATKIPQPVALGEGKDVSGNGDDKHKAVDIQWHDGHDGDDDDDADEEDEGFVTSSDYHTPERRKSVSGGQRGFGDGSNDETLYS